jgi:hypothetical protein
MQSTKDACANGADGTNFNKNGGTEMSEAKQNLLKDWKIEKCWDGNYVVYGYIFNDAKNRFVDGAHIHTSRVLSIDFVEGVVKTKNSTYNLEIG